MDGSMIDPVPVDVVKDMGADIAVGVNVVPQLKRGVSTAITRAFKHASRLNPFSYLTGVRNMPDVLDVLMNSIQAVQFELGNFKSLAADVTVNVEMAEFTWVDFHRATEIITRGQEAGERAVTKVREALEARVLLG